jgi:thymidylate synthase
MDNSPKMNQEHVYLDLLRDILTNGEERQDRTGTGTLSVFGRQVRFNISESIPVLTTKKVAYEKVIQELLWFLRGSTNAKELQNVGVHIWNGNSSRVYLDSRGLSHLPEGDIGAGYGFQWRNFGGVYKNCNTPPDSPGFDQIKFVIDELKTNPTSRRIFFSSWNPIAMEQMALPPCHVSAQFYVSVCKEGKQHLSCHMYQRSVDTFLGFPWNMISYSVLTHILATLTGMKAKELIVSTGDTHIYLNHINQVQLQLQREPYNFPTIVVNEAIKDKDISEIDITDIQINGYVSHSFIGAKMSV